LTDVELSILSEMGARSAAIRLVAVNPLEYAARLPIDEAALEAFFTKNTAKYSNCMQASHILLKQESEAQDLRRRIVDKREDFAALAKQYSQDPVSAESGGRLGWFFPDGMIEAFSQAALALAPGEISQPVKSQYGYHLIRLEARRAFTKAAEMDGETREQLVRAYKSSDSANYGQQAEKAIEERLNQLRNMVSSGKTDFAVAARSLGLQPIETGFFKFLSLPPAAPAYTNLLERLAGETEFQAQAFALAPGSVSPVLRLQQQMVVLSPISQRYDTNRSAAVAANPQRLQALPERLRDEISKEITFAAGQLQQRSQYLLFNDWISSLWAASGTEVNWKAISGEGND
jgi:hypothetical protein